jgi:hypothetical protein
MVNRIQSPHSYMITGSSVLIAGSSVKVEHYEDDHWGGAACLDDHRAQRLQPTPRAGEPGNIDCSG